MSKKAASTAPANSSYALWNKLKEQGLANRGSAYGYDISCFIEIEGFNPRDYDDPETIAHIRSLADSYMRGDTMPPLLVKVVDDKVYIWDGHCRYRGAKLAISEGAPLKFLDTVEMTGDQIEQHMTVLKTRDGLALKPLQIALQIHRLYKLMGSEEAVAAGLGKSKAYVSQHLEIYNLPLELKQFISSDVAAWSTVTEAFRDHGTKAFDIITAAVARKQAKSSAENDDAYAKSADEVTVEAEANPKPKELVRVRRADIVGQTGCRPSFSKTLVKRVTDGFNMLGSKLDSLPAGSSATVSLTSDEIEMLRQLVKDVQPKEKPVEVMETPSGQQVVEAEILDSQANDTEMAA